MSKPKRKSTPKPYRRIFIVGFILLIGLWIFGWWTMNQIINLPMSNPAATLQAFDQFSTDISERNATVFVQQTQTSAATQAAPMLEPPVLGGTP